MPDNHYSERERLVIDLYKNQNKSIREIAKVAKMSFRDIGFILKKEGLSHGLAMTEDDNKNKKTHPNNEKATQAYKLFSEGKSLMKPLFSIKQNIVIFVIVLIIEDNKSSNNEKFTQAYKCFSEGKTLVQVSIELGLREKEASNLVFARISSHYF